MCFDLKSVVLAYFNFDVCLYTNNHACLLLFCKVDFKVTYEMSQTAYEEDFQIAIGTISSLGVIYAGFRTYVWSRRAGRITIDFPTLANLVFFLCGTLSNCFFVVTYGIAFYFFIFYKVI